MRQSTSLSKSLLVETCPGQGSQGEEAGTWTVEFPVASLSEEAGRRTIPLFLFLKKDEFLESCCGILYVLCHRNNIRLINCFFSQKNKLLIHYFI